MSHFSNQAVIRRTDSYKIVVGSSLGDELAAYLKGAFPTKRAFVIIDSNVNRLHGTFYQNLLGSVFDEVLIYEMPAGETSKSTEELNSILDFLLGNGIKRVEPLLAIGGGVAGDLAGFAAASALRGVPLVHIPTTLLAMVDSSIGGKTGINHSTGKNRIGAFYQPRAIFADVDVLETLPEQEWLCGLGEVIKYACISDPGLFPRIWEAFGESGFSCSPAWVSIINDCMNIKRLIVEADEREAGQRAFLNFGHTFAHAIEASLGYGAVSHGEAVYFGLLAETHLATQLGHDIDVSQLLRFLKLYHQSAAKMTIEESLLQSYMKFDKKNNTNSAFRFALVKSWGDPFLQDVDDAQMIRGAWQALQSDINQAREAPH